MQKHNICVESILFSIIDNYSVYLLYLFLWCNYHLSKFLNSLFMNLKKRPNILFVKNHNKCNLSLLDEQFAQNIAAGSVDPKDGTVRGTFDLIYEKV